MTEVFIGLIAPIVALVILMLISEALLWMGMALADFARGAVKDE